MYPCNFVITLHVDENSIPVMICTCKSSEEHERLMNHIIRVNLDYTYVNVNKGFTVDLVPTTDIDDAINGITYIEPMPNNIIKCNIMIDNECKELTDIEIENLDINIDGANGDGE